MRIRKPFCIHAISTANVCLLLGGLGCNPRDTTTGKVEISYWEKLTGFEGDAMQVVIDDFNRSQDRLFVKRLTAGEIERKFMLATAGGDPPDVVGLWTSSILEFSEKGASTPLNGMRERAGVKREDYIPVFWDLCSHHGFMRALPIIVLFFFTQKTFIEGVSTTGIKG